MSFTADLALAGQALGLRVDEIVQESRRAGGVANGDERSTSWTKDLDPQDIGYSLFDYQEELSSGILEAAKARKRSLVSLPTGAGKTRTAISAAVTDLNADPKRRWLWIAPSYELLDQATRTFISLWRTSRNPQPQRIAYRGQFDDDASIWFQTPQSLRSTRLALQAFDTIVFDEAHQLGAPTFREAVKAVEGPHAALVGLSATPGRRNDQETEFLVDYFGGRLLTSKILGQQPVDSLIRRGVLSKLSFRTFGDSSWDSTKRVRALAILLERLAKRGRRTLGFTRNVAESVALSFALRKNDISADYVDSRMRIEEREDKLERFAAGQISVLLNQRLLATGYDCPAVSDVVLGSRIGSPVLFEQMVGRAARGPLTGGSSVARIWDFDDHLSIHGLPQSYYRFRDFEWQQA